jgi:hypothetical protein
MLLLALLASAGPGAARMSSSQHKADAKAAAAAPGDLRAPTGWSLPRGTSTQSWSRSVRQAPAAATRRPTAASLALRALRPAAPARPPAPARTSSLPTPAPNPAVSPGHQPLRGSPRAERQLRRGLSFARQLDGSCGCSCTCETGCWLGWAARQHVHPQWVSLLWVEKITRKQFKCKKWGAY